MRSYGFKEILFFILFGVLGVLLFSISLAVVLALCVMGAGYLLYLRFILPWRLKRRIKETHGRVFEAEYTIIDENDKHLNNK